MPRATKCMSRSLPTRRSARSAAAARSSRSAGWTRRGARPSVCARGGGGAGGRREAEGWFGAVEPFVKGGVPVVGLEPSCILGFRDEVPAMIKSEGARQLSMHALMFEEFLVREAAPGRLDLPLKPIAQRAIVHGHCHQKAFGMFGAVERILRLVPGLKVETVESSCCGMA